MRMWMLPPTHLCDRHLREEHEQLHRFLPSIRKKAPLTQRIQANTVEPLSYAERHDDLAAELVRRGFRHGTPLAQPDFAYLRSEHLNARVDTAAAQQALIHQCNDCAERYKPLPLRKPRDAAGPINGRYVDRDLERVGHRGVYEPNIGLDPGTHTVTVGPFVVRILRRADYTVFSCSVLGVEITRQVSYPSLAQLADDLKTATRTGALEFHQVESLWDAIIRESVA